jgi:antitoxin component YwqK of YwqJK toxin-antitoxin module
VQRADADELEIDFGDGETYFWQGKLFTGIAYELWPDGTLRDETEYQDGRSHNTARDWYPEGQLHSETAYYRGVIYGLDREWDERGRLRKESLHEYGYWLRKRAWDEEGRLTQDQKQVRDAENHALLQKTRDHFDKYLAPGQKARLEALAADASQE